MQYGDGAGNTVQNSDVFSLFRMCWMPSARASSSSSFLSTIRRQQPPQRVVLSQIDCFVQSLNEAVQKCKVVGSQVSLDGVQPRDTGMPWWSLPVLSKDMRAVKLCSTKVLQFLTGSAG